MNYLNLIYGWLLGLAIGLFFYRRSIIVSLRRAAEEHRRLQGQLEELQRAAVELDQLAMLKDEFSVAINHQLRTPVTSILEGVGLIHDLTLGPLNEDQQVVVATIERNVERLVQLLDEVLDLSLLKSGRRPLKR